MDIPTVQYTTDNGGGREGRVFEGGAVEDDDDSRKKKFVVLSFFFGEKTKYLLSLLHSRSYKYNAGQ